VQDAVCNTILTPPAAVAAGMQDAAGIVAVGVVVAAVAGAAGEAAIAAAAAAGVAPAAGVAAAAEDCSAGYFNTRLRSAFRAFFQRGPGTRMPGLT